MYIWFSASRCCTLLYGRHSPHFTHIFSSWWTPRCPLTSITIAKTAMNVPDMARSHQVLLLFRWPYHRWPECHWCHLEGASRCWAHWKRSWDTSRHQGQRNEPAPRNGQIHGQQQETSCNLKCKHVWWMAPSRLKGGGNRISRNAASEPKLPGETAFPMPAFFLFSSGTWRNGDWKESR